MPQTTNTDKPEAGHISILAKLLEGIATVDLSAYIPEAPTKCSHYVELGVMETEQTRRMVVLRSSLIDAYNAKVKVLNDEGRKPEDVDRATRTDLADKGVMIEALGTLINYDVELCFPSLKAVGVPIQFGPDWVVSYTDHSLQSQFAGLFRENGDAPQGLKDLLAGLGGMTVVIGRGGPGRTKDDPPLQ